MTPIPTRNRYWAFSPARASVNGSAAGVEVQPTGSFNASWPALPAGALLINSTETTRRLLKLACGTMAWRGETLSASAGSTARSRLTTPYGACDSRRDTGSLISTGTPFTVYEAVTTNGAGAAGRKSQRASRSEIEYRFSAIDARAKYGRV